MVTPSSPARICVSGAETGCRETQEGIEKKKGQGNLMKINGRWGWTERMRKKEGEKGHG